MRYTRLDGLRGLLSVMVALNHSFMIVTIPYYASIWGQNIFIFNDLQSKIQQILMLLGNGGLAVSLFFVLSGLVLVESSQKWELTLLNTLTFYGRRFLRLYPVYAFLIVITAIYIWSGFSYEQFSAASPWFLWWMNFKMTFKELLFNLSLIHIYIGGVTWTLRVILVASAFFPLMLYLSKKLPLIANILIIALLAWGSFGFLELPNFIDLRFLFMFYLGTILPKFKKNFSSTPAIWINLLILPLLFAALYFRYLFDIYYASLAESIFAFFLLGQITYNEKLDVFKFLENQLFKFLGKISYSLYLVHFSVLYVLARLSFQHFSPALLLNNYLVTHVILFVVSLVLATAVSTLMYHFIEMPSHSLSRKIKNNPHS